MSFILALATAAQASTVDVLLSTSSDTYSSGGGVYGNIDLGTSSILSLSGNAGVLAAGNNVSGVAASPTGPLYGGTYLYVTGDAGSAATFSLAGSQNTFGFTWGTIDDYNTLTLTDALHNTFTITGADILNHIAGSVDGTTQSDVVFTDPFANIVSAVLTSSQNSFEAGNFSQNAVPLPASAVMFGMALVGLALVSRRKQQGAM